MSEESKPKRGRGRPRKPDHELSRPRKREVEPAEVVVDGPVVQIEVGDTRAALALLDEADQKEIERESRRASCASDIAKYRWQVACNYHRLETGEKLNFEERPFLVDIYKDDAMDLVVHGSAQFGKPLEDSTLILVPSGVKAIGDLKVGDFVIAVDGMPVRVLGVYPQGEVELLRVEFADGRHVDAGINHLWEVDAVGLGVEKRNSVLDTNDIGNLLKAGVEVRVPRPNVQGFESIDTKIKSVTSIGRGHATCIMVDHPRHLFVTANGITTHNTEWMICDLAVSAGIIGLKVLFITSKQEKRNKFVAGRINPCFNSVPAYKKLFESARDRAALADSTGLKHFGAGSINFLFANASARGEFTSWPADKYMIDEHQECHSGSLLQLPNRLSGSPWKFKVCVGHPSSPGSQTCQNLDFLYQNSDQRRWYVTCGTCRMEQELDWWASVVEEERTDTGAIISVKPRDKEFISDANGVDMKPQCIYCKNPINRLTHDARWKQLNPGAARHGYRLSNLYNVNERIADLYSRYLNARHIPEAMFDFYTKQLGICYSMSGTQITEKMLRDCATGDLTSIRPYAFEDVSRFNWRKIQRGNAA